MSNISLDNQNTITNTYKVNFDLSWENSWRTSTFESNWDTAWIVIKYREIPNTEWLHATLSAGTSVFPSGVSSDFTDNTGVFVYRSSDGIGPFTANDIELTWNYGSSPDDATFEICIIAIEMVYIPEDGFWAGDGSLSPQGNFQAGTTSLPYPVVSEGEIL